MAAFNTGKQLSNEEKFNLAVEYIDKLFPYLPDRGDFKFNKSIYEKAGLTKEQMVEVESVKDTIELALIHNLKYAEKYNSKNFEFHLNDEGREAKRMGGIKRYQEYLINKDKLTLPTMTLSQAADKVLYFITQAEFKSKYFNEKELSEILKISYDTIELVTAKLNKRGFVMLTSSQGCADLHVLNDARIFVAEQKTFEEEDTGKHVLPPITIQYGDNFHVENVVGDVTYRSRLDKSNKEDKSNKTPATSKKIDWSSSLRVIAAIFIVMSAIITFYKSCN